MPRKAGTVDLDFKIIEGHLHPNWICPWCRGLRETEPDRTATPERHINPVDGLTRSVSYPHVRQDLCYYHRKKAQGLIKTPLWF